MKILIFQLKIHFCNSDNERVLNKPCFFPVSGVVDKSVVNSVNVEAANICDSPPCQENNNQTEGLASNLESLDATSIANLYSSLSELIQSDDPSSVDSGFLRSTAMNKLLLWKDDISKKLEVTESEIDSLENEHKLFISDTGSNLVSATSACSLPVICIDDDEPPEEPCAAFSLIQPAPLQPISSGNMIEVTKLCAVEEELAEGEAVNVDRSVTATSKLVQSPSKGISTTSQDDHNHGCGEYSPEGNTTGADHEMQSSVCAALEESVVTTFAGHIASSSQMIVTDIGVHGEQAVCDIIMASNKDSANRASEAFNKLLPPSLSQIDISNVDDSPRFKSNPFVKDKFAMRKRFLRFKERVIALKFRAFRHLWKEDLRMLSIRRSCVKSQKKFEQSSRLARNGYQKNRSSIRSRFSSPGMSTYNMCCFSVYKIMYESYSNFLVSLGLVYYVAFLFFLFYLDLIRNDE